MNRWLVPPAALYSLVEHTPGTVLLESAGPAPADSGPAPAYSEPSLLQSPPPTRLFTHPLRICVANHPSDLPSLFQQIEHAVDAGLCAAGYFAYECGAFFEPAAAPHGAAAHSAAGPLAWFGIYEQPCLFDHPTGAFIGGEPPGLAHFRSIAGPEPSIDPSIVFNLPTPEERYAQSIAAIHEWIRSGDVYQLNFTLPLTIHAPGSAAALYRQLRSAQPAPYCAFLHTQPDQRILSFSPELFFRLENQAGLRRITTQPMKGTAPRGRTTREDRARAEGLRNDPKNRAENVMIVDLLRNDLGRLCAFASVRAENLFAVERYPTLWQMTSTITGNLRPEVTFQQIFRALFPCGSVTGAPKIRAMQLLAQLEQRPRGVYTGAIGFFSKEESIFNVAIRTIALNRDRGTMGVGSGIVIDSQPAAEWRECLLKAQFLTHRSARPSPDSFSLVETMLWRGEYPLLDLHLDRLQDSAHYFGFPVNRAEILAALETHAANSLTRHPRAAGANSPFPSHKVRLLLDPNGVLSIASEPLPQPPSGPLRIRIAQERTDPQDPMYFHKTTHRPLYAQAFQSAIEAGYDDVLFLNQRNEATETAIHNIFIEKDSKLLTPPIESGLLAGVHRRHILSTNPNAEERVLNLADLRTADAIYLTNAVRGLRSAVIAWHREA